MAADIKIGDIVKIRLKGETPWAKLTAIKDKYMCGTILNTLAGSLHSYKKGDIIKFKEFIQKY